MEKRKEKSINSKTRMGRRKEEGARRGQRSGRNRNYNKKRQWPRTRQPAPRRPAAPGQSSQGLWSRPGPAHPLAPALTMPWRLGEDREGNGKKKVLSRHDTQTKSNPWATSAGVLPRLLGWVARACLWTRVCRDVICSACKGLAAKPEPGSVAMWPHLQSFFHCACVGCSRAADAKLPETHISFTCWQAHS